MTSIEKSDAALKTIGEVALQLDVATHVLRFWETKFHQIRPQKRRGRRYYRAEDVVVITRIKELLYKRGYTIKGVQKYLLEELRSKSSKAIEATIDDSSEAVLSKADLFGNNANQSDANYYTTDLFGNVVPASGSAAAQGSVGSKVPPKVAVKTQDRDNEQENISKLKQICSGLQEARQRLREVA